MLGKNYTNQNLKRLISKHAILIQNGIKIYPTIVYNKFRVCIEDEFKLLYKKKTTGRIDHDSKSINKALEEMVNFVYKKIQHKL